MTRDDLGRDAYYAHRCRYEMRADECIEGDSLRTWEGLTEGERERWCMKASPSDLTTASD